MAIVFDHMTMEQRVLFGTGRAVEHVSTAVDSIGAQKVLLIVSPSASELGGSISRMVPIVARIDDVVQHVPEEKAVQAVARATECKADLIVSVGGGSAVGLAKIVACETGLPIVAVPTTFSGSEATDVWGLTRRDRKLTGSDPRALPKVVVYDAALTLTLPERLTMASGVNAIAHAVDSFWAPRANPINKALGTEGLRSLVRGLRQLVLDSQNMEAREQMIYGAYLAAVAFASAGSGMHHKICHTLGGTFNLPHAETHSVMIGYVVAFNSHSAPDVADRIADAFKSDSSTNGIFTLQQELKTPRSLQEIGFEKSQISAAAEIILQSVPPSNPRPVDKQDLEYLLSAAWAGTPLG